MDVAKQFKHRRESTAMIALLFKKKLKVINIGSCGFIVVQESYICRKTYPMFHKFSKPIQMRNGSNGTKVAKMAELGSFNESQ